MIDFLMIETLHNRAYRIWAEVKGIEYSRELYLGFTKRDAIARYKKQHNMQKTKFEIMDFSFKKED